MTVIKMTNPEKEAFMEKYCDKGTHFGFNKMKEYFIKGQESFWLIEVF